MKNKLRFISVFIIVLISLGLFSVPVSAQGVYANIESISTYLEIPEQFTVTSANVYSDQSLTYEVEAITADNANNLIITSEKTNNTEDIFNFKYLSKKDLDEELLNINSSSNTICGTIYDNVTNASYKEQENAIVFNLYNRSSTSNATAYTIINGQLITVQYISNDGELTVDEKGIFNKIVDSITVNQLYQKPQHFKLSQVFGKVVPVIIVFAIILAVLLFVYYASGVSTKRKSSRQLADKYYNELKNEGLMDEAQQTDEKAVDDYVASTVIEPSEKVRPKDYQPEASVMDSMRKPKFIEDEWEDVDLEKMFALPDQPVDEEISEDDFESITENPSEYLSDSILEGHIDEQKQTDEPEVQYSRADSAKRYAKMFMGSDVEPKPTEQVVEPVSDIDTEGTTSLTDEEIARLEERHRQRVLKRIRARKGKKRRKRSTQTERSATTRPSKRKNRSTDSDDNLFGEFELDGYWDKYRS